MAGFGYDNPGSYEDNGPPPSAGLIPKGWQPMKMLSHEEKTNATGWRGLVLEFEITRGDHKGRRIWPLYTTHHQTSTKAVEIGRGKLGHLIKAAGKPDAQSPDEVQGIEIAGFVGIKKGTGGYDDKNDVLDFQPFDADAAPAATAGGAPSQGWAGDGGAGVGPLPF